MMVNGSIIIKMVISLMLKFLPPSPSKEGNIDQINPKKHGKEVGVISGHFVIVRSDIGAFFSATFCV